MASIKPTAKPATKNTVKSGASEVPAGATIPSATIPSESQPAPAPVSTITVTVPSAVPESDEDDDQLSPEQEAILDEHLSQTPTATPAEKSAQSLGLNTLAEITQILSRPIPPRLLKQVRKGNDYVTTVPWQVIKKYLDTYARVWELRITNIVDLGDSVSVFGGIRILTSDCGWVQRDDVGEKQKKTRSGQDVGFGGASIKAQRQLMKRSAVLFGLGIGLYDRK